MKRAPLFIALLHHPVLNKHGKVVATSVTNMDIHDLARQARTFGVEGVFIQTPVSGLQRLAAKIVQHWSEGVGGEHNPSRKTALEIVRIVSTLDHAIVEIERATGRLPRLVATSARNGPDRTTFPAMRAELETSEEPHLLLFGTGWGLIPEMLERCDTILEPICGPGDYNHLPVRGAAAIVMDRLCAESP